MTLAELKEKRRAYLRAYREANKDRIKEYQRAYRETNKDRIKEQQRIRAAG